MATSNPGNLPDAPNQQVRAALIERIQSLLATNDWTQQEAARLCGQTQPRISDLRRGATERFSLDSLVNIATALARHATTREGSTMEYTEADGERLVADFMAKLAAKPVKGRYPAATESSTTGRGGKIIATSGLCTVGGRVALVGDAVRYPDGSQARIVSGAGAAMCYDNRAIALVGSALDNGDTITGPEHSGMVIVQYADEPPLPGLLEPVPGAAASGEAS
jgi:predicted XRE-type DNA-binding protein